MTLERTLARLVAETPGTAIGEDVRSAAVRQLFDCVGVTLAAASEPAGRLIAGVTAESAGREQARVIGTAIRTSAQDAAWANGSLAHLLDFDDTGFSHPTACILPAGFAVAELVDASGADLVEALVLGYEVFERLAVTARPSEPLLRERGIHPTSIWGAPAAAAAAARLLGLGVDEIEVAFGIAATGAAGLTQQFGSWSKGINAGNAARGGVQAALLARAGYRADREGIGGRYGLLGAVVGHENLRLDGLEEALGTRWAIHDPGISIKPYPACTSTLRAVDAMLAITRRPGYAPDRVVRIVVDVHPDLLHTLRFRRPADPFSGKFSLDYTVAAAAFDGSLTLESFGDEAGARAGFRAMLDRVELREHPEWPIRERHRNPVTVTLADGTELSESVPAHLGSRANPLAPTAIEAKFRTCASRTLPAAAVEAPVAALQEIDSAPSVRQVLHLVTLDAGA